MITPHPTHGIRETPISLPPSQYVLSQVAEWKSPIYYDDWKAIALASSADIDRLLKAIECDAEVCSCPLFRKANVIFLPGRAADYVCYRLIDDKFPDISTQGYSMTQVCYRKHLLPEIQTELGSPGAKATQGWFCCVQDKSKEQNGGKGQTKSWSKDFAPTANVLAAIERLNAKARQAGGKHPQSS